MCPREGVTKALSRARHVHDQRRHLPDIVVLLCEVVWQHCAVHLPGAFRVLHVCVYVYVCVL